MKWGLKLCDLEVDEHYYPWLAKPYAVSKIFKSLCRELTVQVISQQLAAARADEQQVLNIQENNSLIRQVYLQGDGVPWSYGRVVVPHATYLQFQSELDNLGTRLIGEAWLYEKADICRGAFEYCKLSAADDLYNLALQRLNLQPQQVWARRSIFDLNGFKMLVMELYLPTVPAYPLYAHVNS